MDMLKRKIAGKDRIDDDKPKWEPKSTKDDFKWLEPKPYRERDRYDRDRSDRGDRYDTRNDRGGYQTRYRGDRSDDRDGSDSRFDGADYLSSGGKKSQRVTTKPYGSERPPFGGKDASEYSYKQNSKRSSPEFTLKPKRGY